MHEVLIVEATRSALVDPHGNHALGWMPASGLLAQLLRSLLNRAHVDLDAVDQIIVSESADPESSAAIGERAWESPLLAGSRSHRPKFSGAASSVAGLKEAIASVGAGLVDVVLVAGLDRAVRLPSDEASVEGEVGIRAGASELARIFGLSGEAQERYRQRSMNRARLCRDGGDFTPEITPIIVDFRDGVPTVVDVDDIAEASDDLPDGVATGAPLAGMSECVAGVVVCSEVWARANLDSWRARVVATTEAPSSPDVLDGPIRATRQLLDEMDCTVRAYDHCEIDETTAAVPASWTLEFEAEPRLLNPRGGALALGETKAAAGCRMVATMLGALDATGGRSGLIVSVERDGHTWAAALDAVR